MHWFLRADGGQISQPSSYVHWFLRDHGARYLSLDMHWFLRDYGARYLSLVAIYMVPKILWGQISQPSTYIHWFLRENICSVSNSLVLKITNGYARREGKKKICWMTYSKKEGNKCTTISYKLSFIIWNLSTIHCTAVVFNVMIDIYILLLFFFLYIFLIN